MKIQDGWFEENEDGTRDYIAILENDEVWRFKNAYPVAIHFDGLEVSDNDNVEIVANFTRW
jgi:hypothetical protein